MYNNKYDYPIRRITSTATHSSTVRRMCRCYRCPWYSWDHVWIQWWEISAWYSRTRNLSEDCQLRHNEQEPSVDITTPCRASSTSAHGWMAWVSTGRSNCCCSNHFLSMTVRRSGSGPNSSRSIVGYTNSALYPTLYGCWWQKPNQHARNIIIYKKKIWYPTPSMCSVLYRDPL